RVREPSLRWLFGPYALRGGVDLVLSVTRSPAVAAASLGGYGVGTSTGTVMYQTVLQTRLSAAVRGRAFALLDVIWHGSRLTSLAAGGVLADAVGIQAVYLVGGVLLLAAAGIGAIGAQAAHLR
ncbi:MAG: MFS transporter, partial [Chloroflexi bacterium]|nr:MFS transporter [Chloroflexota bacterium]